MAGEVVASNVAWNQEHRYLTLGTSGYYRLDVGSNGYNDYYGCGHAPYCHNRADDDFWVRNEFTTSLYYKTSDGSSLIFADSVYNPEGSWRDLYAPANLTHMLRWVMRISIPHDHIAYLQASFYLKTMTNISHSSYPSGRNLKVGVLNAFGVNPTYSSGNRLTIANFLIVKE